MPNGGPPVSPETRAAVQAQADTLVILVGELFKNNVMDNAQVQALVNELKAFAAAASAKPDDLRKLEGAMMHIIADELGDAIDGSD